MNPLKTSTQTSACPYDDTGEITTTGADAKKSPNTKDIRNKMINMKKRTFAICAATLSTLVKPKSPAIIAMIKNTTAHMSIQTLLFRAISARFINRSFAISLLFSTTIILIELKYR
jgi:hypothetical protein